MRLTLVVILSLLAAGCISPGPSETPAPSEPDPADESPPVVPEPTGPTFCAREADCTFWDDLYHEYVVYDLDTVVIDVVIMPPPGNSVDGTEASRMAVQAWEAGIRYFAQPWFNESIEINILTVGQDVPSLAAVEDPEIIVISASAAGLVGIGLEPKQIGCILLDEGRVASVYDHSHGQNRVLVEDCTGVGFTCFALNVGAADPIGLYDLIAHEVGHCLGGGHVGDALDFSAKYAPINDIMSYQNDPAHVHCVSNLNVRVLEGVYGHLLQQPEEMFLPRGSFLAMEQKDYLQAPCDNPPSIL